MKHLREKITAGIGLLAASLSIVLFLSTDPTWIQVLLVGAIGLSFILYFEAFNRLDSIIEDGKNKSQEDKK